MIVHVNLQREAAIILQQMAKEAGVGLRDMVEIGAYNLVALWMRERGLDGASDKPVIDLDPADWKSVDAHDGVDRSG